MNLKNGTQSAFRLHYEALILMVRMSAKRAVLSVCAGVLDGTGTANVLDPAPLDVRTQFCIANSSLKWHKMGYQQLSFSLTSFLIKSGLIRPIHPVWKLTSWFVNRE